VRWKVFFPLLVGHFMHAYFCRDHSDLRDRYPVCESTNEGDSSDIDLTGTWVASNVSDARYQIVGLIFIAGASPSKGIY
jgi:hypothetical protein